jgi:hypothetical protein
MRNLLVIILAMFVCFSIVGCKDSFCVCEDKEAKGVNENTDGDQEVSGDEKVHRDKGVYGDGVWVLEVDIKEDKLMKTLSYVNWYLSLSDYSKNGNQYAKKITWFDPVHTRFIAIEVRKSVYDENSQTLSFYVFLKNNNNELMSPYDKPSMIFVESLISFMDELERGEIGEIQ